MNGHSTVLEDIIFMKKVPGVLEGPCHLPGRIGKDNHLKPFSAALHIELDGTLVSLGA